MSLTLRINDADVDVAPLIAEEHRKECICALESAKKRAEQYGGFEGVLEPEDIAAAAPLTVDQLAEALLPVAAAFAVTPISHFNVGAIARCNGRLVFGANAEWGSLTFSVHAEQCAVSQTLLNSARCRRSGEAIECIYVNHAPCGLCRQFLSEQEYLQGKPMAIHVHGRAPVSKVIDLLPEPFLPSDLEIPVGIHPMEGLTEPPRECARGDIASPACEAFNTLIDVSRAMYTHAESAVAVQFGLGSGIVAGAYIENAAYNPSFLPINGALMSARFCGRDLSKITKVVMLEMGGGVLSNKEVNDLIHKLVCPNATFDYFVCEKPK